MRTATLILLSLAAMALWGCVQVEAKQSPALAEAPESLLREITPNLPATPSHFPSATPTPTPFPTATPGQSQLRVEMLLSRINTAMGGIRSFQAEGNWNGEKSEFIAFDLQGNRMPGGNHASFLEQSTIQAALSGELALEDMSLEQVISKDWKRAYRITGTTANDSETDQVVFLVDPEQLLILELKGYTSSSGREVPGALFDVRFSHFNEPVETPAPELISAGVPAPEFGPAPTSTILPGSVDPPTLMPTPTSTPRPTPTTAPTPVPLTREEVQFRVGRGISLRGEDLTGIDLSGASLNGAKMFGVNLTDANLAQTSLKGAHLNRAIFDGALLEGTNFENASLIGADLSGANLSGANFFLAKLDEAKLNGTNLTEAELRSSSLKRADLRGAIMVDAKLYGTDLSNANLEGTQLRGASLDEATLTGANLSNANFTDTSLQRADLSQANLTKANLTRADLYEAQLQGSNLFGALFYNTNVEEAFCQSPFVRCTESLLEDRKAVVR